MIDVNSNIRLLQEITGQNWENNDDDDGVGAALTGVCRQNKRTRWASNQQPHG